MIEGSVSSFNSWPMVSYQPADGGTAPRIKFGLMFGLKLLLEYTGIEGFALILVGFKKVDFLFTLSIPLFSKLQMSIL